VAMQSNLCRSYLIPSTLGAGFTVRDEVEPVFNRMVSEVAHRREKHVFRERPHL